MNRDDLTPFAEAWGGAWDQYGRNQTSAGIKMAFRALAAEFDLATVRAALTAHVREQPSQPPTVAAIRERVMGDPMERTQAAWSKLRRAIRRAGPYRSVAFDDPIIHCAVRDMGGWSAVNDWTADEVPFRQRDFERAYRAYVRQDNLAHPPYLVGIVESHNAAEGYALEPPTLIGDAELAQGVIEAGSDSDRAVTFQARDEDGWVTTQIPQRLLGDTVRALPQTPPPASEQVVHARRMRDQLAAGTFERGGS